MTKWVILIVYLMILACSENQNRMHGDFSMQFNVSEPEKLLFKGKISISENDNFILEGHDYIKWPWQDTIKPSYHKQEGSIIYNGNSVKINPDKMEEGGWQFSGEFEYCNFKEKNKADNYIQDLPAKTQYYYFKSIKNQEFVILRGNTFK